MQTNVPAARVAAILEPLRDVATEFVIAVDSRVDIYVGEVAFSIWGRRMDPPRELKSLKKLKQQLFNGFSPNANTVKK